ncbi:MAG TPA: DsbA family protein [Kofleriaceae bacterium]|nr:DsbA family protein [Kofleriaceae bacterium]
MIIAKRLKGKAIATWLGPTGDAARRALSRARQRITSASSRLDFYFDIADPMSYLTAQAVTRLIEVYPVDLAVHVITPPASDVDPAPVLRTKHAVRDAELVAQYWNVEFPGRKEADPGMVRDAGTALIRDRPGVEQLRAAVSLGTALWSGDKKQLGSLLLALGTESSVRVAPILNSNYAELRKAGHYQGAMLHYGDAWYWGIDRLPYLEAQLASDLGVTAPPVVAPRPEAERGPLALSDKPLVCELWFSFRSPYSYLALERIEQVLAPHGVPLVAKPVPPMVDRGLPVPAVKRAYMVRDAKREADRLGIPFGELCDPLGKGVDHCLAIAHWAARRGQGMAFARSALRGIWAEALDVSEYVDLRRVVERAGLPWDEAKAAIGDPEAAKAAQASAAELAVYSLWGVPSIRCGELVAWGQDRLPLLADRLRRHALAKPS